MRDKTKMLAAVNAMQTFFTEEEDVEYFAFQLRRAAFMLVSMGATSDFANVLQDISDINYRLHQLAEKLDPYFGKYELPERPVI